MCRRCRDPRSVNYHRYGARGIGVCQRWADSFENFIADMGPRPTADHSVDRIDTTGGYEPSNCRWATKKEQMHNRADNVWIESGGRRMLIGDWATELGLTRQAIAKRLRSGCDQDQAVRARGK
jgi:hypothetical protein